MRAALLAAIKTTDEGRLRAELKLGGRSVLAWQVAFARVLGCEKILCLYESSCSELLRLKQDAQNMGGEFHALRDFVQLTALVKADDELVVLCDGLVIDVRHAQQFIGLQPPLRNFIASLPAGSKPAIEHPQDFERIDAARSWAGLTIMRAAPVQQLAEHPGDSDAISLLLRIALQARLETVAIDLDRIRQGEWLLASGVQALQKREQALIRRSQGSKLWAAPGLALAEIIVRRNAYRGLDHGPVIGVGGAILLMAIGALLVELGFVTLGLVLAAGGAFCQNIGRGFAQLRRDLLDVPIPRWFTSIDDVLIDVLAVFGLSLALAQSPNDYAVLALAPLAIGLARLAATASPPILATFWTDRAMQLAIFAACTTFGGLSAALALFGLAALAQLLLRTGRQ